MRDSKLVWNLIHPDDQTRFHQTDRSANDEGKNFNIEIRFITPSGKMKWIQLTSRPIPSSGTPRIWCGFMLDITTRKRAEEAVYRAKIDLEAKVKERTSQLAAINESLVKEIRGRTRTERKLRVSQKTPGPGFGIGYRRGRARQQFATNLHDTLVQSLGAVKLRIQLIRSHISDETGPEFKAIDDILSASIIQARNLMAGLISPVLYELGLIPAMEEVIEDVSSHHNISITFTPSGCDNLRHELNVFLFQALREFLNNIVKHSQANQVIVMLKCDSHAIRLTVKDNGRGFARPISVKAESTKGFGLFSIRERLRHLGGHLAIQSRQGTVVKIVIPLKYS